MDNVGAEVGQKMRSAVKAKLMELGSYVDDELPDYIMVMVANKRTKSQMNQDLELFLNTNTSTFVDWLHIVLKKLQEITVTNTSVLKRLSKRKSGDSTKSVKVKKEKKGKEKMGKKAKKKEVPGADIKIESLSKSLTDNLPVKANKLSEVRKIVIMKESNGSSIISNEEDVIVDSFDIPPLSQVSNESELNEITKKIKSVKSRLGIQVRSGSEDEDYINLKADPDDLFSGDAATKQQKLKEEILRKISILDLEQQQLENNTHSHTSDNLNDEKNEHPRISFEHRNSSTPTKRMSVLERLGKKPDTPTLDGTTSDLKRKRVVNHSESSGEEEETSRVNKISRTESINHQDKSGDRENKRTGNVEVPRESALKRLGLMSKIAIPHKEVESVNSEEDILAKEVPSAVKVKPRALPPSTKQANKNLLLKAVADAERSVAQTPLVGGYKHEGIYTKKYREKSNNVHSSPKKLSTKDKNSLRSIITNTVKPVRKELDFSSDDDNLEYIPKPIKRISKSNIHPEYIPSSRGHSSDDCDNTESHVLPKQTKNQTFIITLDGISRNQDVKGAEYKDDSEITENRKRRAPSPIIFDSHSPVVTRGRAVPDRLPSVSPHSTIKSKERCRFWPTCRQGEKCEFVHPNASCRTFPQCKFGDKCLYIHPTCKFETSCTRKDCPYNHTTKVSFTNAKSPQMCKFYPNCSNIHCSFYHPKTCKYGKNCKNPQQCTFSHTFPSKSSLTWRSSVKS